MHDGNDGGGVPHVVVGPLGLYGVAAGKQGVEGGRRGRGCKPAAAR